MDFDKFRLWLNENTTYTNPTKSNIVSRVKRANSIIPIINNPIYLFKLSQSNEFNNLTVNVKSQIRRAVKLYLDYLSFEGGIIDE